MNVVILQSPLSETTPFLIRFWPRKNRASANASSIFWTLFPKILHDACRSLILRFRKKNKIGKCSCFTKEIIADEFSPSPKRPEKEIGFCYGFASVLLFNQKVRNLNLRLRNPIWSWWHRERFANDHLNFYSMAFDGWRGPSVDFGEWHFQANFTFFDRFCMVFQPHFEWFFIDGEGRAWIFRECILDANFTFFVARNCLPFFVFKLSCCEIV